MLVAFGLVRGWSAWQSDSGISAFEEARAETLALTGIQDSLASLESAADISPYHAQQPDYSLWDQKRIDEYQAAIRRSPDAPHAVLTIEDLNIKVPVYNGASDFNLNRGVARILGTGRIGEVGNLGIAGHRDGFFRPLKDIQVGDSMFLETYLGSEEYRVSSVTIVEQSELDVLAPSETATITLVTCYPFYYVGHAPKRFIVKAEALPRQANS